MGIAFYRVYRCTDINIFECAACGVKLKYGNIITVGGHQGEWQTKDVELCGEDTSYLHVTKLFYSINRWSMSLNNLVQLVA